MSKIINNQEIRVFGIKRSGNHAIINWLFYQIPGQVVFANHCYLSKQELRIYKGTGRIDCKGINYWDFKRKYFFFERNPFFNQEIVTYSKNDKRFNSQKLKQHPKDALIISFEDKDIAQFSQLLEQFSEQWVGKSQEIFSIVILRDPFNLLASIYKKWGQENLKTVASLWEEYAQTYLSYQENPDGHYLGINYNQWLTDVNYRQAITERLQIPFDDSKKDMVANFAGGSSFDGLSYQQDGQKMNVLNRWQTFQEDSEYYNLFKNPQLLKLSEEIFGIIPGTEDFIASLQKNC
jgi:hypothetical protein